MALKRSRIAVTGTVTKPKNEIPTVLVPDEWREDEDALTNKVARFNQAAAAMKLAEATKKELNPQLQQLALPALFDHNGTVGSKLAASVKLVQQRRDPKTQEPLEPDGTEEVANIQFKAQYSDVDADKADAAFEEAFPDHDINDYVTETVTGVFDSSIWLKADGSLNTKVYKAIMDAVATVVVDFNLRDDTGQLRVALATQKTVKPKETFHTQRWEDFTVEEQAKLSEIFPNTVAVVPAKR